MKKFIAISITLLITQILPAYANCEKGWEVSTLARSNTDYFLISQKNEKFDIKAAWIKQLLDVRHRVDNASGIFTRLIICDSDDANAFAWREGGANVTAITLGMVKLLGNDFDAYACLLGHENAHLVLNHSKQRADRAVGSGILQLLAGIAMEVAFQRNMGIAGLGADLSLLGNEALTAAYGRGDEIESDEHGIRYAVAAGFDPAGALKIHQLLGANSSFLGTHPSSGDRIKHINKIISQLGTSKLSRAGEEKRPSDKEDTEFTGGTLDLQGRGQILSIKSRLGYFIGVQIGTYAPKNGMKISLSHEIKEELTGTIYTVIDGYFSVVPDQDISLYKQGKEFSFK